MKFMEARDRVIELIRRVIDIDSGNTLDTLCTRAKEYNIQVTKLNMLWVGVSDIEDESIWDNLQLCVVYKILQPLHKEFMPPVEDFFTSQEIRNIEEMKGEIEEEEWIVIKDVREVKKGIWSVVLPLRDIVDWDNKNKLNYNRLTQRPTIKSKTGEQKNDLNKKHVNEIVEMILKNKYRPVNSIRLNVLLRDDDSIGDETKSKLEYNENKKQIKVKGSFDIVDGYHRLAAFQIAFSKNPNLNLYEEVKIFNYDIIEARDVIAQLSKEREMDKEYTAGLQDTHSNNIVDNMMINKNLDPLIRTRIVRKNEDYESGMGFVLFNDFSNEIERCYSVNQGSESNKKKVVKWLIEFFNIVVDEYITGFRNYYGKTRANPWYLKSYGIDTLLYLSTLTREESEIRDVLDKIQKESFTINKKLNEEKIRKVLAEVRKE